MPLFCCCIFFYISIFSLSTLIRFFSFLNHLLLLQKSAFKMLWSYTWDKLCAVMLQLFVFEFSLSFPFTISFTKANPHLRSFLRNATVFVLCLVLCVSEFRWYFWFSISFLNLVLWANTIWLWSHPIIAHRHKHTHTHSTGIKWNMNGIWVVYKIRGKKLSTQFQCNFGCCRVFFSLVSFMKIFFHQVPKKLIRLHQAYKNRKAMNWIN